jgi:hypothetical protein
MLGIKMRAGAQRLDVWRVSRATINSHVDAKRRLAQ